MNITADVIRSLVLIFKVNETSTTEKLPEYISVSIFEIILVQKIRIIIKSSNVLSTNYVAGTLCT